MHLTPRETEKLLIYQLGDIAQRRKAKGLKLNHPESMSLICSSALEGAREGKTVEEVMKEAAGIARKATRPLPLRAGPAGETGSGA